MNTARERALARIAVRSIVSPVKGWAGTHCIGLEGAHHRPDGSATAYDPRDQKMHAAHRLVWELTYDETPREVVHMCPNRWCINVEHLVARSAQAVDDRPLDGREERMTDAERAAVIVELGHWAERFAAYGDCVSTLRKRIDELKGQECT